MTSEQDSSARVLQAARAALVASLRPDIRDERVLRAIDSVRRELFVPLESHHLAYADRPLPIGHGQTISQPRMVAIMLQELALSGDEKVLEVGSGSGYQAALLGVLAREVVAVELIPELADRSRRALREAGATNVTVHVAGEELGRPEDAPYDVIIVAAAAPRIPQALVAQLAPGGRLAIPVGERGSQYLTLVERRPEGLTVTRKGQCAFVPLVSKDAFPDGFNGRD
jgi:protein-L-isoaspartate(D-aspartate) O-methyltransferase